MANSEPEKPEEPQEGHLWLNIGRTVFLVAALVAAWYVLEWLMGSK